MGDSHLFKADLKHLWIRKLVLFDACNSPTLFEYGKRPWKIQEGNVFENHHCFEGGTEIGIGSRVSESSPRMKSNDSDLKSEELHLTFFKLQK